MSISTPPNGMVSNTELILRKILGEDVTPLPPNSRVEFYLIQVEEYIERLATGATRPIGETTTPLTDGATTNPITIDGESYTAQINDLVFYQNKEFLFTANGWREVGDITNLNADMIDDTNTTNKFATQAQLDQINTNKNNILLVEQNIRKNIATINNGTNTEVLKIPVSAVANKSYQISIASLTSDETTATLGCKIVLMNNNNAVSNTIYMERGNNKTDVLTTTGPANSLWIYASAAAVISVGKSVTVANLMLCDKALYDAGYTDYQPYIPTLDEDIKAIINPINEQVELNKNNISSEQAKTTGMTEGGSNYITVGGIPVYVSATAPTGAQVGDLWIGG